MSNVDRLSHFFDRLVVVAGEVYLQLVSGGLNKPHKCLRMIVHPHNAFAKSVVDVIARRKSGMQEGSENKKPIDICVWALPSTASAVSYLELYQPAAC